MSENQSDIEEYDTVCSVLSSCYEHRVRSAQGGNKLSRILSSFFHEGNKVALI